MKFETGWKNAPKYQSRPARFSPGKMVPNPNPKGRSKQVTEEYAKQWLRENGGGGSKETSGEEQPAGAREKKQEEPSAQKDWAELGLDPEIAWESASEKQRKQWVTEAGLPEATVDSSWGELPAEVDAAMRKNPENISKKAKLKPEDRADWQPAPLAEFDEKKVSVARSGILNSLAQNPLLDQHDLITGALKKLRKDDPKTNAPTEGLTAGQKREQRANQYFQFKNLLEKDPEFAKTFKIMDLARTEAWRSGDADRLQQALQSGSPEEVKKAKEEVQGYIKKGEELWQNDQQRLYNQWQKMSEETKKEAPYLAPSPLYTPQKE